MVATANCEMERCLLIRNPKNVTKNLTEMMNTILIEKSLDKKDPVIGLPMKYIYAIEASV